MNFKLFSASWRRGWQKLVSRRLYLAMFMVPLLTAWFFVSLMGKGLPNQVPVAIVDLDHSQLSRTVTRNLQTQQLLEVTSTPENYHSALQKVRSGEIFGFFLIPADFEKNTIDGKKPTLALYSNMTYFVPGTLSFKGFKTVAVATSAGVAITKMQSMGMNASSESLQPVSVVEHPLGNPWLNYSYYLTNSFAPGMIALMVMLMTCFSICEEFKRGTSVQWLETAGGSMTRALTGKLLPQAIVWSCVGIAIQILLFKILHFPLHNHIGHMFAAMVMTVIASQGLSVLICEIIPNLRLSLSINSLIGILAFSIAGFSFPVESMYPSIGIISYLLPVRYYFLIYADQALNGIPLFYSRLYFAALALFVLLPFAGLRKLRNRCLNPIYIP